MTAKEKVDLFERAMHKLYINRNIALNIDRMNEILDAIDFWARFDQDKHKGSPYQKLKALDI